MKHAAHQKGVALVEVVVAAAIIASSFVAILGVYVALGKLSSKSLPRLQAAMLAEEGVEAVRSMRDSGFSSSIASLSSGTNYGLSWSSVGSSYSATTSIAAIDNTFYRSFTVANAYRDGDYDLASSGTADPDSRLVTVNVSWNDTSGTSTYSLQSYVFNTFHN